MVNMISFVNTGNCPNGWTEDTSFINRIPAFDSADNAGTTGGNNTTSHYHSSSISSNAPSASIGAVARDSTYGSGRTSGPSVSALLPLHVKVRFCKKPWSGGTIIPSTSLVMFDGTCPVGFTYISTFNNRHPVGATTSLGTTGETAGAHSHTVGTQNLNYAGYAYAVHGNTSSNDFMASTDLFSYVKVVLCRKS